MLKFVIILVAMWSLASGEGTCEIKIDGTCYWTDVHNTRDVNYREAERICNEGNSEVAVIHTEEAYNRIVELVRSKIPITQSWTVAWIRTKINPQTLRITPADAFVKQFPYILPWRKPIRTLTNFYIEVKRRGSSLFQGMVNREPQLSLRGVVCQKLFD